MIKTRAGAIVTPGRSKATPRTCSIPAAGEVLGVGKNAAYEAAKRGDIYYVQVGKKKRVPLQWLERKLAGEDA